LLSRCGRGREFYPVAAIVIATRKTRLVAEELGRSILLGCGMPDSLKIT